MLWGYNDAHDRPGEHAGGGKWKGYYGAISNGKFLVLVLPMASSDTSEAMESQSMFLESL